MILPARIFSLLDRFAFAGQIAFFQGQRPLGIFQFLRRRETAELRIRRRVFEHAVFLLAVDRRRIGFRMKRLFGWHFVCSYIGGSAPPSGPPGAPPGGGGGASGGIGAPSGPPGLLVIAICATADGTRPASCCLAKLAVSARTALRTACCFFEPSG